MGKSNPTSGVRPLSETIHLPAGTKIVVRDVSKVFKTRSGEVEALRQVSFTVREGEFICIVGPSGCGKTTLLRILAGLERQTSGKVYIVASRTRSRENSASLQSGNKSYPQTHGEVDDNQNLESILDLAGPGPLTSVVFQEQSVFPWLTVRQNVEYGLRVRGVPRETRRRVADYYIQMIGLGKFAGAYPHQLSGGMKQRTSVARAFANNPEILLLDEPFGALDEQNRVLLQQELLRIWEGSRKTAIFITHSIDEALILGDRVLVMTARPGTVKAVIDVNLPRPRKVTELKSRPEFLELFNCIWERLSEEVLKAREAERTGKGRPRRWL